MKGDERRCRNSTTAAINTAPSSIQDHSWEEMKVEGGAAASLAGRTNLTVRLATTKWCKR